MPHIACLSRPAVRAFKTLVLCAVSLLAVLVAGCGVSPSPVAKPMLSLQGTVHGGQQPVGGAAMQLYAVGTTGDGSAATALISTRLTTSDGTGNGTNANANVGNALNQLPLGSFTITGMYSCPSASSIVYLVATGGNPGLPGGQTNPALAMVAMLGRCGDLSATTNVSLNELTTFGSIAPLTPYMTGLANLGSGTSDAAAFASAVALVGSYTDTSSGSAPGPSLPGGFYASTTELTTLADILASCINSDGTTVCQQLFTLATPPGGVAPTDTITATLDILKNPDNNTAAIYSLLSANPPFQPTLLSAPASWALPILPIAAPPTISPASGSYAIVPTITLSSSTPGAVIRYTVDGTVPTSASPVYTSGFTLSNNKSTTRTVRAITSAPGYGTSAASSVTYTIPAQGSTTNLMFLTQPTTETLGTAVPAFRLGFVDSYRNPIANAYATIQLSLANNDRRTSLTGTTQTNTGPDGTVTVTGVYLNNAGVGYSLLASWSNGTATSAPFDVISPPITMTTLGPLEGAGTTLPGSFTLAQAAPTGGLVVTLGSSNAGAISIAPSTVTVPAGQTSGSFTYTSAGAGTATLRASATGYSDGTSDVSTTNNVISFGTLPSPLPGVSAAIPLTLSTAAPAGGVVVTLTSGSPAVATVPATATFAAGSTTPSSAPQLSAKTYGITQLIATATGYGPAVSNATIAGSATVSPTTMNLGVGTQATGTITLAQPAPAGGVQFSVLSDKNTIASQVSTVSQVPAGATTITFTVTGYSIGSTTIRINSPGFAELPVTVNVTGSMTLANNIFTQPAAKLYIANTLTLSSTPGAPVDLTLTSSNPGVLLLSLDPNAVGTTSLTVPGFTGRTLTLYEQGQAGGTANITVTASAGYTTLVAPVTVNLPVLLLQSLISNNTLTSTSPSGEVDVALGEASTNGSFVGICAFGSSVGSNSPLGCKLNPGQSLTVDVTSSNTAVGTITGAPVTLTAGSQLAVTHFQPVGAGTANVALGTLPAGIYTSAAYPFYTFSPIAITVAQPTFTLPGTSAATRTGITSPFNVTLSSTDTHSGGAPITVAVSDGSIASLSTNGAVLGGSSITIPNVTLALPTLYLQGLSPGSTSLTFSSPGYKSVTTTLTVANGSIIFNDSYSLSGYPTDAPQLVSVGLPCVSGACFLNPGVSNQFTLTSSNPSVAAFTNPITLPAGASSVYATLNVLSGGTATFGIGTVPAPLVAPSTAYGTITRTGNFSNSTIAFNLQPFDGVNLTATGQVQVQHTSVSNPTLTLTSSNPAVAVVSTNVAAMGSGTAAYAYTAGPKTFYVQGLSQGTTTITASGAGYVTASTTVTVLPSGIVIIPNTSITTTAFADPTPLSLYLAMLDPTTGAIRYNCPAGFCTLNPGASVTATVTSSDTTAGTIGNSQVTFPAGSASAQTSNFLPNDLGKTTVTVSQPAGFTVSAAGASSVLITVSGDAITAGSIATAVGLQVKTSSDLPYVPPHAVSITVSLADPTLGRLSLDPNVLGTGTTLTFNNVTCQSAFCTTGGPPFFYVQGLAAGYTQLLVSAKGFGSAKTTVAVNKAGMTVHPALGSSYIIAAANSTNVTVPTSLSMLDPYSNAWLSDCVLNCVLNPGVAPGVVLTSSNTGVGSFPATPTPFNPTAAFATVPFTAGNPGFATYTLGAPVAGFSTTTTPNRTQGLASVYSNGQDFPHELFIASHDVDAGVGLQVVGQYSLSGTVIGYDTTPFTIAIADPTIALLSATGTSAGSALLTHTGPGYLGTDFYIQGLKAGTTTVTISGAQYTSRTFTVNVRPAGFTVKQRDTSVAARPTAPGGAYYGVTLTVKPALLDAQGQWLADATLSPQTGAVTVAVGTANAAVGTTLQSTVSFAGGGTQGTFEYDGVALGTTTISLGAVSAPFIQATTYQTVNATTTR